MPCAEYASLLKAASYLHAQGLNTPLCAAFGITNPVTGDQVAMTNHHWKFSVNALREGLGLACLVLLNDFTALGLSLPLLPETDKRQVGGVAGFVVDAMTWIASGTNMSARQPRTSLMGALQRFASQSGHWCRRCQ